MMVRKSDEHDSTVANYGVFIYALLLTFALFLSDWVFDKSYLSETIIGIIIGYAMGWIDKSTTYFFQRRGEQLDKRGVQVKRGDEHEQG